MSAIGTRLSRLVPGLHLEKAFIPSSLQNLRDNRPKFVQFINTLTAQKSSLVYNSYISNRQEFPDEYLDETLESHGLTDRSLQVIFSEKYQRFLSSTQTAQAAKKTLLELRSKREEIQVELPKLAEETALAESTAAALNQRLENTKSELTRCTRIDTTNHQEIQNLSEQIDVEKETLGDLKIQEAENDWVLFKKSMVKKTAWGLASAAGITVLALLVRFLAKNKKS